MSREESSLNEIDVTRENHAPLLILVLHSVIVLHIFISRGTFTIIGTYLSFIFRVGRGGGGVGTRKCFSISRGSSFQKARLLSLVILY